MISIIKAMILFALSVSFWSCFAQEPGANENKKAMLIGVSQGNELIGLPMMPGIDKDLKHMKSLLESQGYQVSTMMNPDKTQLLQKLEEIAVMTATNDFVFYYSGHSADNSETGYLVPVLSAKTSLAVKQAAENGKNPFEVSVLVDELVSSNEIHSLLKLSLATRQLVVIDGNTRQMCKPKIFSETIKSSHFYCAGPDSVARSDGGVFTSLVIEGLKGGADKGKDIQVDALELDTWLKQQIPEKLGEKTTLMQNPAFFHFGENRVLSRF
jgi:hypothetical protein